MTNAFNQSRRFRRQLVDMEVKGITRSKCGPAMMTTASIKSVCKLRGQYITPKLNDELHLQYQGFTKIEVSDVQTILLRSLLLLFEKSRSHS